VSTDHAGNLLVTDAGGRRVRVVAASTGTFYGQEMTAGDIYTIAGDGNYKYTGDGVPATTAGLSPFDAVADPAGNVIIADADGNQRVRLVAASTGTFYGREMTAGDIYTIAGDGTLGFSGKGNGGRAVDAELADPYAVAVDHSGNVVFADHGADLVWVVAASTGMFYGLPMTAGDIYVVAGNGRNLGNDGLGDGGPAVGSSLSEPDGVAISPAGDLLVGDELDNRVRAVSS
jgi:DNA-binding beta-propeller fold protein YncE